MSNTKPLTDQTGRPVGMVVTPKGARIEVLGDPLPPSQRGASIHVAPKGGGRPHGDFPVKNPNSGPTAKQKKPAPKIITPIDNGTIGRVYTMQLPAPGTQNQNTRLAPDGRPWHEMGWDEIERVGAEAFERWKKAAQTAWDALPGTADAATTAAARQSIGEGVMGTLEGLGTLAGPPAEFVDAAYMSGNADAIALVEQMQQNQRAAIGAIGDSVKSAWNEAYARNGAVGASAMVLATLGMEAVGGKGLGALGKAAGTIADIVRVAKTPMEAAKQLDEAIAAAKAAGASADEIALLERARAERLAQARREAAQGKDGVVILHKKPPPAIFSTRQLDKKFKHAEDFGLPTTKKNPETLSQYQGALESHLNNPATYQHGAYQYVPNSTVHFNPSTNNVVVLSKTNEFVTGWKLTPGTPQFENYLKNGVLR